MVRLNYWTALMTKDGPLYVFADPAGHAFCIFVGDCIAWLATLPPAAAT